MYSRCQDFEASAIGDLEEQEQLGILLHAGPLSPRISSKSSLVAFNRPTPCFLNIPAASPAVSPCRGGGEGRHRRVDAHHV